MEEKNKECSSCKKGLSKNQWSLIFLSMYILFSSIYGTYEIFKKIYHLFF